MSKYRSIRSDAARISPARRRDIGGNGADAGCHGCRAGPRSSARLGLGPSASSNGEVWGAAPTVYANGSPLAQIPPNSVFYLDLPPGTHSFAVEPYGEPTGATDTVRLAPGSQNYLEIQWAPTWEMGYASGGRGDQSHSFLVLNVSPEVAQAYLPSLTDLGQR